MSPFFIKHPAIAAVIAIVTTLLGIVCMSNLPIAQYPEITPVTIQLQAMFPGADAQSVADSVGTPLERQISGVQGMDYMTSVSSNNGVYNLSVIFEPGRDPDINQVLTNMRYGQASSQLPAEVQATGVTIKQQPGLPLLMYTLWSPEGVYDSIKLSNYAQVKLIDDLKRVPGVGEVVVYGAGRYAIRIWLDTAKMAHYGISVNQVRGAIAEQNATNPGGTIGADPVPNGQEQTFTVRTQGRLTTPEEFSNILLMNNKEGRVYLKDVARVELGSENYSVFGRLNGHNCASIAIYQAPGSNAIETADRLIELLNGKAALMPPGLSGKVSLDTTTAVRYSIDEIKTTFIEAVILVVLVVFLFLQSWRATLIPLIAVPVSLLTTFCVFPVLGFSLNTISLLGMVLAIGLVVDDAIVVVEAVQEHINKGLNPRMASFAAMQEVSGPVVAIALVLAAVFLPSLLLEGITGTLFKQFAVTIAISMLISAFNALTLSPALCALILKPNTNARPRISFGTLAVNLAFLGGAYYFLGFIGLGVSAVIVIAYFLGLFGKFFQLFNWAYDKTANGYTRVCGVLARNLWLSIPILLLFGGALWPMSKMVPNSFLPDEDQGYLLAAMTLKDNTSLQVAATQNIKFEAALADETVENITSVVGINILNGVQTPGACIAFVQLKEWKYRSETAKEVAQRLQVNLAKAGLDASFAMVLEPPAIPGVGTANGVTMVLTDMEGQGVQYLREEVTRFQQAAKARPEIGMCTDMMMAHMPQKRMVLDVERCLFYQVNVSAANSILGTFNGSSFVNYFNAFGQQWQVYMQAQGEDRSGLDKMDGFFVTNDLGQRVPLSSIVKIEEIEDTEFVMLHNARNSAKLNIFTAPGYSTQQAMEALEQVYAEVMNPTLIGFDYQDMSYQENKVRQSLGLGAIFTMSAVFAFLILVALYEKWTLPLSVFLTVPIAVLGAYLGLYLFGMELNLYAQVGLVMLVGLAAKNAILIVEFANLEMERGKELMEATLSAARMRLRPILMTSFAFILGCVPLLISAGSGALARHSIGIVVVVGMGLATLIGVFLIPCSYVLIMRIFRIKFERKTLEADPDEEGAREYLIAHENEMSHK